MNTYTVTISLNELSYQIEAESEDNAIDQALDKAYDEKLIDILDGAIFSAY